MDQLTQLVSVRFIRVRQILETTPSAEYMRSLKQQQRGRCQKQNWIVSMMRNNKNNSIGLKKSNFEWSFKIMKIIDPSFELQISDSPEQIDKKLQQNFLQEFVTLYRLFFDRFQQKFNFKVKIRNFLRPTNHNIINDLIKYLVDFSRDYYQQIFFWHMRGGPSFLNNQLQKQNEDNAKIKIRSSKIISQQNQAYQIYQESQSKVFLQQQYDTENIVRAEQAIETGQGIQTLQQKLTKKSIDHQANSQLKSAKKSKSPKKINKYKLLERSITVVQESKGWNSSSKIQSNPNVVTLKKMDYLKNYEILEIKDFPSIAGGQIKANINPQLLKLRMNEHYRDMKFRNALAKTSSNSYFNRYQKQLNPNNPNIQIPSSNSANPILNKTLYLEDKSDLKITFPFKVSLTVEKNGFSCINVCLADSKSMSKKDSFLSPIKEKGSVDIRQYKSQLNNGVPINFKNQFSLSSLRVLRVSQNFLPPLIHNKLQAFKNKNGANSQIKQTKQYRIYYQDQARQKTRLSMGNIALAQEFLSHNPKQNSQVNIRQVNPQINYIRQVNPQINYNWHPFSSSEHRKQTIKQKNRYYDTQIPVKQVKQKQNKKKNQVTLGMDTATISIRKNFNSQDKPKKNKKGSHDPEQKIMEWLDKIRLMKQIERKKIMGFG